MVGAFGAKWEHRFTFLEISSHVAVVVVVVVVVAGPGKPIKRLGSSNNHR